MVAQLEPASQVGRLSETAIAFARSCSCGIETVIAFVGAKWVFLVQFSGAEVMPVSMVAVQGGAVVLSASRSSPVEWCNRFVSFGVGYALSWSGGSSCPVGWGVSRDLVRMSRLR